MMMEIVIHTLELLSIFSLPMLMVMDAYAHTAVEKPRWRK